MKYESSGDPEDEAAGTRTRYAADKTRIRQIQEEFWEGFTKDMERDIYGAQKKIWKMVQSCGTETGETVKLNRI